MGLNMYLVKKTFVGGQYDKGVIYIEANEKKLAIDLNRVTYIDEEIGYWRKAYAIHNWFVNNCQDGVDDCRDAYVSKENLETLLELCKQVKKNKKHPEEAMLLLPTKSGFFFGNTDYEDWYFEDIDTTIAILEKALAEDMSNAEYSYHSSW